jgi:hypothetical protein
MPQRIKCIVFLLLCIIQTCYGQFNNLDTLFIVFAGGQSNMLCLRAEASLLPESEIDSTIAFYYHQGLKPNQTSYPKPFISTSDSHWTFLQPQKQEPYLAYSEIYFGPEITLARTLSDKGVKNIGIFKLAYGGTNLTHDWKKGDYSSAGLYALMMDQYRIATDSLTAWNIPWKFIGMAWMQGEADAANAEYAAVYKVNLTEFISDIRNDFNAPEMPVVLGKIVHNPTVYPYTGEIRAAQEAVADEDTHVEVINLDDLPLVEDGIHFDTEGVIAMGKRMGNVLYSLINSEITAMDTTGFNTESIIIKSAYPNPLNSSISIHITLYRNESIDLQIIDLSGKPVSHLARGDLTAGEHNFHWNGNSFPTGMYIIRFSAGKHIETRKILLIK